MSYSNCYGFFMLNGIVFYAFLGVPQPYTIHTLSIHYPYTMTRPDPSYSGFDIQMDMSVFPTVSQSKEMTKTWFDPMLITRIKSKAGEKFVYQFRGEIGGFGIGSDLAWQMQAVAGYQFSRLFSITGGYRIISLDYETGSGQDYFHYNIDTAGPTVKFSFMFQ